ncbi:DUF3440 domain-containing protein [Candidatus Lokiarchaeum ossiferum]|uniref:DUF3440 domain-containing protein n=1 Tax=Candidatus Lokiarchaeum ossiferum TaxID=2951803 RepID=UPI00352D5906
MPKHYLKESVYEAAVKRVEEIYQKFDRVYISFSGGKDSSVMVHLAVQVARKLGKLPVHAMLVDLEGNYQTTIDHIIEIFDMPEVQGYWVALPIHLRNAVSQYKSQWIAWNPTKKSKWIRPLPTHSCAITEENYFPFYKFGMEFEEFVPAFGEWFAQGKKTASIVAIRSDESLNRYRTIVNKKKIRFQNFGWTTKITPNVFNAYPIYDWKTQDIWTAVGKFGWSYNKLYDLMYLQGRPLSKQRICQPYGDDQKQGLDLFHECEPETWSKVVNRVPGANMGSLYRGNPLLGNIKVILPEDVPTWKEYVIVLLASMPRYEAAHFISKIRVFLKWWSDHGWPLEKFPDAADPKLEAKRKTPSWRRIAKTLIKNDHMCKGLSFSQTQNQMDKQQAFFTKYKEDFREYAV